MQNPKQPPPPQIKTLHLLEFDNVFADRNQMATVQSPTHLPYHIIKISY